MTICISAIAKEGDYDVIVFATDHMVSTHIGSFEYSIKKYKCINQSSIAMLAGDSLMFNKFIENIPKESSLNQIKNKIFENMKKTRQEIVKNAILDVYGLQWDDIRNSLLSENISEEMSGIIEEVGEFELESQIMLIGFDDFSVKIFDITEFGIDDYSDHHFHAIGSGTDQALNTLLFQRHSKENDLTKTIYNVFKAKKNAEVMEGVGNET